jgi:hypothetical protein
MSYVEDRISRSTSRIDGLLNTIAEREAEARERANRERMRADAAQAREDAERTHEIR